MFQANVGNPYLILFLDNIPSVEAIKEIGKKIENNPISKNEFWFGETIRTTQLIFEFMSEEPN